MLLIARKNLLVSVPIILLLVASAVVLEQSSFSRTTTLTNTQVSTETDTEYVTRMQMIQATSTTYVFTHSSVMYVPPETVTATSTTTTTVIKKQTISAAADQSGNIILLGGQNGSWFTKSQYPRLFQISIDSNSSIGLNPAAGEGTVWSGVSNGSDWLISGWGSEGYTDAPNPYLYLYNGTGSVNDTVEDSAEAEWQGGDVFAIQLKRHKLASQRDGIRSSESPPDGETWTDSSKPSIGRVI